MVNPVVGAVAMIFAPLVIAVCCLGIIVGVSGGPIWMLFLGILGIIGIIICVVFIIREFRNAEGCADMYGVPSF